MAKELDKIIDLKVDATNTALVIAEDNLTFDIQTEEPLSLIERQIAEMKLKAYSPKKIATELGLSETQVKKILNTKRVKEYINEATKLIKQTLKDEMVAIYVKTIEDKIKYIEEKYDGDFSKATRKDLPDLIKMLDDILKEEEKAKLGTTQNVFVNILNQVIDKN